MKPTTRPAVDPSMMTKRKRGRPATLGPHISFSIQLPDFVYAALNAAAVKAQKSMGELGRDAIIEWLVANNTGAKLVAAVPNLGGKKS